MDVAVFAGKDGVAPDENPVIENDAAVVDPLRIEKDVVIDDDIVSDTNLVRVSQHDVLAEGHVPSTCAEHQWVELGADEQAERTGHPRPEHHQLVEHEREQTGPADDELGRISEPSPCFDPRAPFERPGCAGR